VGLVEHSNPASPESAVARRYLDLLQGCLTRQLFVDEQVEDALVWPSAVGLGDPDDVWPLMHEYGLRVVRPAAKDEQALSQAHFPPHAETMAGDDRLANVRDLVGRVVADGVPGDLVETGVWRGGTVIWMRALLDALGDDERLVWACDSFQGLPPADEDRHPLDAAWREGYTSGETTLAIDLVDQALMVSLDQVKANVARYGLLDDRIRFVEGWFKDTLPTAPIDQVAILRLDGDLYESTIDALVPLEPKLSPGGYVIVDDYNSIDACKQAVTDYRAEHGITDPIHEIDWTGVWWQKSPR
jgi:hypothetical protein